ncbi:MAG: ABC transporter permease [Candidatus Izemoplasmatales bacterium]|nr:ABC transporter permease [Candidatus Izemoplasmatales bacterium]
MKLAFSIAKRFLLSGKGQTIMIVLGIAIGVSVQVFIGSLITGLQKSLVDKTIGSSSQVTVSTLDSTAYITNFQDQLSVIQASDNMITVASPAINQNGALVVGEQSEPVLARGFDFNLANDIYHFDEKLVSGRLPQSANEIAVGSNLLENLSLALNDEVTFQVPLVGDTTFTIVGVYDFNVKTINETWILTTLATLQTIKSISSNEVSSIEMQISDVFAAETVALNVQTALQNDNLTVDNWIANNAELLSGLQGQSTSSLMIQVFVMLSVILGIASVLAITVLQKSKQIGILKAMGIQDKDASLVFLLEGFILGIFGAALGVGFGLGLSVMFTTFAIGADGNPVVPLFIDYGFIGLSAMIAVAAATIASLIPARKSSKLSVIEVIRNA